MKNLPALLLALLLPGCMTISGVGTPSDDLNNLGAVVLERRDRDPASDGLIDGVVFFPPSSFRHVRRLSGDHVLLINTAGGGRRPAVVNPATMGIYRRIIDENHLRAHRVSGNILIYCPPRSCFVFWSRNARGEVLLEVRERLQENNPASFSQPPVKE